MKLSRGDKKALGVGVAACAACCAGPIGAAFAAIGLGAVAGVALFGFGALLVGVLVAVVVGLRRRRHRGECSLPVEPVLVASPSCAPGSRR